MIIGYARCSTDGQSLDAQFASLSNDASADAGLSPARLTTSAHFAISAVTSGSMSLGAMWVTFLTCPGFQTGQ